MSDAQEPKSTTNFFQILGAPSSLTYVCCALTQTMADTIHGDHVLIQAVFLGDVKNRWMTIDRTDPKPIVLISDCPSAALVEFVASTHAPCLVVIDNFEETVFQVIEARDMGLAEALRFVTQSYRSLAAFRSDAALVVAASDGRRPLREFLARIALHFGFEDPQARTAETLAALGYREDAPDTLLQHLVKAGLRVTSPTSRVLRADAEGQAIIRFMASQYEGVGAGRIARQIEWPTATFLDWGRPGQLLRGPIELLGPARFIICGPYFHLPIGEWTAEVVIEIADNASGNRLGVDVFSGEILGGVAMALPKSGVFTFSIPFRVADPFLPLELRFQLLEGAIEGRLALRAAAFAQREEDAAWVESHPPSS